MTAGFRAWAARQRSQRATKGCTRTSLSFVVVMIPGEEVLQRTQNVLLCVCLCRDSWTTCFVYPTKNFQRPTWADNVLDEKIQLIMVISHEKAPCSEALADFTHVDFDLPPALVATRRICQELVSSHLCF